jgi:serine/threonine protein kinase/tetratricopeptide (TPR) repeat protein
MTDQYASERSIFLEAIAKGSPAERAAYLDQACGCDQRLRAEVEALLAAHDRLGSIHPTPPGSGVVTALDGPSVRERAGTVIGPYKLLQQLGEGGMGVVFLAEQTQPVQRTVAVKIIKPGMDSRQVIARFEAERQALALMDHPNIAKVLDAGTTDSGLPYFVMELVKAVPITSYCDTHHLTLRERLDLFVPVCQAVQHAHQKGIIHRDVKPSNVLIARYDGKPVPKVIDFGVAKATGPRLTERTLFTEFGQVVGTLEYMSPEQAELNQPDIDTRSDIYSLGVLLYELLTGTTPLERKWLDEAPILDVLRSIREEEPPKPSTRLSTLEELPRIAANRGLEPTKLSNLVRGELDWIAMKCLEKDRNRRYGTANGLAQDIERYLADEPVEACPPSPGYRLRKTLRRHRGGVLTAVALLGLLVVGVVLSTWQAVLTTRAEALATNRLHELEGAHQETTRALGTAKEAKAATELALRESEAARHQAEAVASLLESAFHGLYPPIQQKGGPDLKSQLAARLDEAAAHLDKEYAGELLTRARLRSALGVAKLGLGEASQAVALFEQSLREREEALGTDHPDTLTTRNNLAGAYQVAGRLTEALALYELTWKVRLAQLGPDHKDTLTTQNNLALTYQAAGRIAEALSLHEETLKRREAQLGPDHPHNLSTRNNLAWAYQAAGRLAEALRLHEETVKQFEARLGPDHSETLRSRNNLAEMYRVSGRATEAVPLHEDILKRRVATLGPDHPDSLTSSNNLALGYYALGRTAEALTLLAKNLKLREARLGPDHPDTLMSRNNLGAAYVGTRQLDRALPVFEENLRLRQAKLGLDHPDTLQSLANLAATYQGLGQSAKALPVIQETLRLYRAKLGPDHPETLRSMHSLAVVYLDLGQQAKALPLFEEALRLRGSKLGPDHPDTLTSLSDLAYALHAAGQRDQALPLLEQALEGRRTKLGPDHPDTLQSLARLAAAYRDAGRPNRSEPLMRDLLERQRKRDGPESVAVASTLAGLGQIFLKQQKYAEAEAHLRQALTIRAQKQAGAWSTFHTQSLLGSALAGQGKYADAESQLLQGYEGLKRREAQMPPTAQAHVTAAVERLVQLYSAWGKSDQAEWWRARLPKKAGGGEKPNPESKVSSGP